ncbi:MAG: hypothetical protein IH845_00700 [Nanoarchaeota archaeon]|nr:hypothetical protein [Nanoarchaeota archaeon]
MVKTHRDQSGIKNYIRGSAGPFESKYKTLEKHDAWNISEFIERSRDYRKLLAADLDEYAQMLTGDYSLFETHSEEELAGTKKSVEQYSLEQRLGFGRINSKHLADLAWTVDPEKTLSRYALGVGVPYFHGDSDEFNSVVDQLEESRKIMTQLTDPREYFENEMKVTGVVKAFYSGLSTEGAKAQIEQWQTNAQLRLIESIGVTDFISQNIENAYIAAEPQRAELQEYETEVQRKMDDLKQSPSRENLVRIKKEIKAKTEEIAEKYNNALQDSQGLLNTLMQMAEDGYSAREQEEEEARNSKQNQTEK